jgi:eukaryotic-like serine/threonine-protein kinase
VPNTCPSNQELLAFHTGALAEDRIDVVSDHLETCLRCGAAIRKLDESVKAGLVGLRIGGPIVPISVRRPGIRGEPVTSTRRPEGDLTASENWPRLPGYEILAALGRGGMGVVYKARHVQLNRDVALKRLRADRGRDLARSRAEAENLARLQHPNIVQIHEILEHEGQVYLALELVEGGSLAARLSGKPQPPREAAQLLEALARAVHFAHRHGIIHRDLKPANILLQLTDDGVVVAVEEKKLPAASALQRLPLIPKVADFGVAKRMAEANGETLDGDVIGTPSYMSPEQASGKLEQIGPAADIYSLGVILYEMLTGRVPIQGTTTLDTLSLVLTEEPVSPRRLQPRLTLDLETVCLKCLEKQPGRRYASAAELADDLHRFLGDEPVRARAPSSLYRFRKFSRRNKVLLGGIVSVLLSLVAGLAVSLFFAVGEAAQRRLADEHALQANDAKQVADEERLAALREAYRGRIAAASAALLSHDVPEAARHLAAAPAGLREWEWRHFHSQLDESSAVFQPADGERLTLVPSRRGIWMFSRRDSVSNLMDENGRVLQAYPGRAYSPIHAGPSFQENWHLSDAPPLSAVVDGTGKEHFQVPRVHRFAMSPDLTKLALVCLPDGPQTARFKVFEAATGKDLRTFVGHTGFVYSLAFSPDGERIASASEDGTARIWNLTTGKVLAVLRGHAVKIYCIAFRRDGARVVTASADGSVRQWDPEKGVEVEPPYTQHTGEVNVAAYSPDGQLIASGGTDRTIRLWRAAGGKDISIRHGHVGAVEQLAFNESGRRLASRSADGSVRIWEVDPRSSLSVLKGHTSYVYPVAFSPNGRWIASGSWDSTVRLWDARSGEVQAVWHHPSPVVDLVFTRDGSRLMAACGEEPIVRVWTVATGQMQRELKGLPDEHIFALATSPDGDRVAVTYGGSGIATILDIASGKPVASFEPGGGGKCAYSPDGRLLALDGQNSIIDLRDTRDSRLIGQLIGHTQPPIAVSFSPDGRHIISAGHDHTVRIWDVDTCTCQAVLTGHPDDIFAAVIHPDGTRVASAGRDGVIWLWDVATGTEMARLSGHTNYVWSLAFSPDGKTLVSGSGDGTIRIWDTDPVAKRYNAVREAEARRGEAP